MDETLFHMARIATARGEIVPLELPDIHMTDCTVVDVKKVSFSDEKLLRRQAKLRECRKCGSHSTRADESKILTVDDQLVCTPSSTSSRLRRTDSTNSGLMLPLSTTTDQARRYSSPNLAQAACKTNLKQAISLPGSPLIPRRLDVQISSVSNEVKALPSPRPQICRTNSFGRTHHSQSANPRTFSTSSSSQSAKTKLPSFKSIYNDLEMNPVLISPHQLPTSPSNMHKRKTGFELRHRVMRRAFRLSDLSTAEPPEVMGMHWMAEVQSPVLNGVFNKSKDQIKETTTDSSGSRSGSRPGVSLAEQFQVLQHCRYLRGPIDIDNQP